jgi:hypothetical protein
MKHPNRFSKSLIPHSARDENESTMAVTSYKRVFFFIITNVAQTNTTNYFFVAHLITIKRKDGKQTYPV